MEYLTIEDLYAYNILDFRGEKLLLISTDGSTETFLEKTIESSNGEYVDKSAKVYVRQRWKVDILPATSFDKTFTTHRTLEVYYCRYEELMEEEDRIFKRRIFNGKVDSNELGDNFIAF